MEIELGKLGRKASSAERLQITKRVTADTWAKEDEKTVAQVTTTREAEKAAKYAADNNSVNRTPADYQKYVHVLHYAIF